MSEAVAVVDAPGGGGKHLTVEQARHLRRTIRGIRGIERDELNLWEAFWIRNTKDAQGLISKDAGLTRARRELVRLEAILWFKDGSAEWFLRWLGLEPCKAREMVRQEMRLLGIANRDGERIEEMKSGTRGVRD